MKLTWKRHIVPSSASVLSFDEPLCSVCSKHIESVPLTLSLPGEPASTHQDADSNLALPRRCLLNLITTFSRTHSSPSTRNAAAKPDLLFSSNSIINPIPQHPILGNPLFRHSVHPGTCPGLSTSRPCPRPRSYLHSLRLFRSWDDRTGFHGSTNSRSGSEPYSLGQLR
jgi:hypothetical protein